MKSITKNNKGFSLVELIVVVLIIAIIAVALAPQVIRWVENSRIASDLETRNDIEKMCQLALTNEYVFEHVKDGGYTITITKDLTGTHVSCDNASATSDPAFWDQFFAIGGYDDLQDFKDSIEIKSTPVSADEIVLTVYVYEDGHTFSTLEGCVSSDLHVS
ncbi:MAG: prepilin-type N-terminal cleavage/methylation domain-containing protein [Lachnospiraceae bacterium]|nr:prepilin-type N-terminal cleavage/methylation domain-containing protein [Lachnospiraceae bacterium]